MLSTAERIEGKAEKIDPRTRRTRQLLFDAFQSLLAEKSFEEITVQDIAERATVNRTTFYAHFADKYALGDTLMRDGFTHKLEGRLTDKAARPHDYLRSLFLAVTDHWEDLHTQCRPSYRMFESLVESQIKGLLFESLRAWMEEHQSSGSRQDREMIATIVSASIYGAAMQWTQIRRTEEAERFAEKAIPVIAASLQALD